MKSAPTYAGIVKEAFELWYTYDKYNEAYKKFEEAINLTTNVKEINFCKEHMKLINANAEFDLRNILDQIHKERNF